MQTFTFAFNSSIVSYKNIENHSKSHSNVQIRQQTGKRSTNVKFTHRRDVSTQTAKSQREEKANYNSAISFVVPVASRA